MRRPPFLALFALLAATGFAQPREGTVLFVDSAPLGARIAIDGKVVEHPTPALFRNLSPGRHQIEVAKDGYQRTSQFVELSPGQAATLRVDLAPLSAALAFPGAPALEGATEATARHQFRYANGDYRLRADRDGTVSFEPIFPDEGLLNATGWGLALLGTAFVFSGGLDLWQGYTGWTDHPSIRTIALGATSLLNGFWYLNLQGTRDRYVLTHRGTPSPRPEFPASAESLLAQAESALNDGNLTQSEGFYRQLIAENPDSALVPQAWFRMARLHALTGQWLLAMGEYELIVQSYPQVEWYDRAEKALADRYEALGQNSQACDHLSAMVLADPFFSLEDWKTQYARLQPQEAP